MPLGGLATMGAISIGGKLLGGLFGSKASAQMQAQLAKAQSQLQQNEQQGLQNYQPYLNAGSGATNMLSDLTGTQGTGLLTPWTQQFTAPTEAEAEQTPGYQFQLKAGEDAINNSTAAQGSLLTGRTLANLNNYAQGTASTNYQNTFNNAYQQYQSAYNTFQNNQNSTYQRLMGLSGQGLQAAGGAGNLISGIGGDIASLYAQKGAAQAGGTMAVGNAVSGGMSDLSQLGMMSSMMNRNGGGGGGGGGTDGWDLPGFAMGTDFAPGGPSIVGERGPEVVNLPQGSQVVPNYRLPANLGGGTNPSLPSAPGMPPAAGGPAQPAPIWGGQPPRMAMPLPGQPSPGMSNDPRMMPPNMPMRPGFGGPAQPFPMWGMNSPQRMPLSALA